MLKKLRRKVRKQMKGFSLLSLSLSLSPNNQPDRREQGAKRREITREPESIVEIGKSIHERQIEDRDTHIYMYVCRDCMCTAEVRRG